MTTVAIIQARMGSTRLPGKIFADIAGAPMLSHVVRRTGAARRVDLVVVATTASAEDDVVVEFCRANGLACSRGSEDDVLSRYYHAATQFQAGVIVRITADCPFIDPSVVDRVVSVFHEGGLDYASNTIRCTYPDGLDAEVFSMDALTRAFRQAALQSEREHVTPFMKKYPELFRLGSVEHADDLAAMRWTVDEPADLDFARAVCARMGAVDFGFEELAAMIRREPSLGRINDDIERDAGYAKSLRHDGAAHAENQE